MDVRRRHFTLALGLLGTGALTACSDPPPQISRLGGDDRPLTMRLSPAADLALMGSVHNGAVLWRWEDGQIVARLEHRPGAHADVMAAAFSPDGRWAATGERDSVVLWDLMARRALGFWAPPGGVRALAVADGGRRVLVGLSTQQAWIIDPRGGTTPAVIEQADAVGVTYLWPDGRTGLTGTDDGMLRVWDLERGEATLTARFDRPLATVALSADHELLFAAPFHGPARLWRLKDGRVLHKEWGERRISLSSARFSADGRRLLTGSPSGEVRLWSVKSGKVLQRWQTPKPDPVRPSAAGILDVAFTPDHASVIAALADGSVIVWPKG